MHSLNYIEELLSNIVLTKGIFEGDVKFVVFLKQSKAILCPTTTKWTTKSINVHIYVIL